MDLGIRSKSLVLSKQQGQIFTSTYLRSPILTLLESLETVNDLYLHDIIHAYDVLLVRITALPSALLTKEGELPALKFLRNHSHELTMCLRRDIGQARSFVLPKVQHTVNQIPDTIPPSLPHQSELILENSQHASIMSHTILGFLSSVFRHPLVLNLFSSRPYSKISILLHADRIYI